MSEGVNLRFTEVQSISLLGENAELISNAISEWACSPFWPLGPRGRKWFESEQSTRSLPESIRQQGLESVTTIEDNSLAMHIRDWCLRHRSLEQSSIRKAVPAVMPLVDRYSSRPGGPLSSETLTAIDDACMSITSTSAVITLTDGRVVRASIATVLALLTTDALMSSVRYPVDHGIAKIIGSYHDRRFLPNSYRRRKVLLQPGAPLVDVLTVLPTTSGRYARIQLTATPQAGVPVALYPLVASVIPEVSGYLVPIINVDSIAGPISLSHRIVATSRPRALLWRLSRRSGSKRFLRNLLPTVLARLRSAGWGANLGQLLSWIGIDRSRFLAVLTRSRSDGNTWLEPKNLEHFEFTIGQLEKPQIAS